ncbi:hypothetical protein HMPREF3208_01225 [Gardnerella vaginalis]|uniref:Uncharacterized protein n=1 Tax=Gardnerella vaginalis TaxID=2702 RepID=A0A133NS42_GARVA|nr:hypothetical protein HMPREF3208_01225 [Gardnerella vaginalis]
MFEVHAHRDIMQHELINTATTRIIFLLNRQQKTRVLRHN